MSARRKAPLPTSGPLALSELSGEPLVSVLLSNYNYGRFIAEALDSVLKQSYRNIEVIVCDDGSTDDSAAVIARYASLDPRIKPIFKENGGQASGFNAAFALASGEIICLMDADDLYEPDKIAAVVDRLRTGEHGIFLHRLLWIDKSGSPMPHHTPHPPLREGWLALDVVASGKSTWVPEPTTAMSFRREVADLVFPVPESLRICADGFLFTMLLLLTSLSVSDKHLGCYRIHGGNSFFQKFRVTDTLQQDRDRMVMLNTEVNARLASLGIDNLRLDIDRSMTFRELGLRMDLLGNHGRLYLLRSYARILRLMVRGKDISRRPGGTVEAAFSYAVGILLPVRLRQWWLSRGRGSIKLVGRSLTGRVRALTRKLRFQS